MPSFSTQQHAREGVIAFDNVDEYGLAHTEYGLRTRFI